MRRQQAVLKPQVGDWADHRNGNLDPRQVAKVSADGWFIWLRLGGAKDIGPFPVENYTFTRTSEEKK